MRRDEVVVELRAMLARVEALVDEWIAEADAAAEDYPAFARGRRFSARDLRAALEDKP